MMFELWLAWRYLTSMRQHRFISLISVISVVGIALGVAALIVVMGVMSGFDRDLKARVLGTQAHLAAEPMGAASVMMTQNALGQLEAVEGVAAVAPFVAGQALVQTDRGMIGVLVKGVSFKQYQKVSQLQDYLRRGHLPQTDDEILVGRELAHRLGLQVGDSCRMISPVTGKPKVLRVAGFFESGMYVYDSLWVLMTLPAAQSLYRLPPDHANGLWARAERLDDVPVIRDRLAKQLSPQWTVTTWEEQNETLFRAIALEKRVMFIILALIILVAAFNIVSALLMTVMEKTRDIGLLRAAGAATGQIGRLFLIHGSLIGALGAGLGLAGGWYLGANLDTVVRWLERWTGFSVFPREIYYFDKIPVAVSPADTLWIVACAFALTLASALYPAWQAARLAPAEALRYE